MDVIEKLEIWLEKQVLKCEREIDKGQPFYWHEAKREAYEQVLEFLKQS
uniref:Uncharacterized protein n=1 Tax=viral metagenome TaxID=1070528 RepID=A0A6M3JNY0_9ZZZZ